MRPEVFELKKEHTDLLSATHVGWLQCEYGAPEIDPKRPYGNSGEQQIFFDMCDAMGIKPKGEEDEWGDLEFDEDFANMLRKLHRELETALQIVLRCKTFEPGVFKCQWPQINWERI